MRAATTVPRTSTARLTALVRDAWRAASAPTRFFLALADAGEPRPLRAALAATLCVSAALGVLSLAFVRATGSDGVLLVWAASLAIALPVFSFVLLVGGLVMLRPAALDVRAWEVAGWAWTPAGALALSLLPAVVMAPGVSAVVGLVTFPIWHLIVVVRGVRALSPGRHVAASALYAIAVFGVPALLMVIGYAIVQGGP
ncbi:MAG: hypothetical protein H0U69_15010 [Trueperaceae bacterium]|nr:hypothetical protein [Trueperaceae bacterium]